MAWQARSFTQIWMLDTPMISAAGPCLPHHPARRVGPQTPRRRTLSPTTQWPWGAGLGGDDLGQVGGLAGVEGDEPVGHGAGEDRVHVGTMWADAPERARTPANAPGGERGIDVLERMHSCYSGGVAPQGGLHS